MTTFTGHGAVVDDVDVDDVDGDADRWCWWQPLPVRAFGAALALRSLLIPLVSSAVARPRTAGGRIRWLVVVVWFFRQGAGREYVLRSPLVAGCALVAGRRPVSFCPVR